MNEHGETFERLLGRMADGDRAAEEALLPALLDELRRLAHREMRRQSPGHTLQTTALVNEAWLRLAGEGVGRIRGREHFLALAARAMRSVLVDTARRRKALKRGAGAARVTYQDELFGAELDPALLLEVDESISRLQDVDPELARVAELRVFGGLASSEVAGVVGRSQRTVERAWTTARAWLQRDLRDGEGGGG